MTSPSELQPGDYVTIEGYRDETPYRVSDVELQNVGITEIVVATLVTDIDVPNLSLSASVDANTAEVGPVGTDEKETIFEQQIVVE